MATALPSTSQPALQPDPVLNSLVTYDPIAQKKRCERSELLYTVILVAEAVFVVASVAFSLYFSTPLFLIPLAARVVIGAFDIRCCNFLGFIHFIKDPDIYTQQADLNGKLINHMGKIDVSELPNRLSLLGITPGIPAHDLKSLFARYCFYKEKQEQSPTIEAAAFNIEAAYLLKVMQSPYETRHIYNFCQRIFSCGDDDCKGRFFYKEGWPVVFSCNYNKLPEKVSRLGLPPRKKLTENDICLITPTRTYTVAELSKKDTTELAREIFELPTPPIQPKGWFKL